MEAMKKNIMKKKSGNEIIHITTVFKSQKIFPSHIIPRDILSHLDNGWTLSKKNYIIHLERRM